MTVDLEDRLRRTFDAVLPLLVPDDAAVDSLIGEPVVSARRPDRSRGLLVAACIAIVVATVAVLVALRGHDSVAPADTSPPVPAVTSVPISVIPADAPAWYQMIAPFLPAGFDHVALDLTAVSADGTRSITYTAINLATDQSLDIHLRSVHSSTDVQVVPVGTFPDADFAESPTGVELHTASGVQVTLGCGIGNNLGGFVNTTDFCEHTFGPSARRDLAATLAEKYPFASIDASVVASSSQFTDLDPIRAAMAAALPDQVWIGQGDGTTVQFGHADLSAGSVVTVLRNVYPADDGGRPVALQQYGTSSVGWTIRHGIAVQLFNSQTGSDRQAQLTGLLAEVQQIVDPTTTATVTVAPDSTSLSTTSTSTSIIGTQLHTVATGDYLQGIAQSYCVTVEALVQENAWPEGIDHPLSPGDVIRIPAGGCLPGTVEANEPQATVDPAAAVDVTASSLTYRAVGGDTPTGLAYQLCTSPAALSTVNHWTDGPDHLLAANDTVIIPLGACIRGDALVPVAGGADVGTITVAGDTVGNEIGTALSNAGLTVSDHTQVSSGLARPDFYDWPYEMAAILPTLPAGSPVVFAVGGNDAQPAMFTDASKTPIPDGSPAWYTEYMSRVRAVAEAVVAAGHPLVWVEVNGVTGGPRNELNLRLVPVADATDYALEKVPGLLSISAWDALRGPDGSSPADTVLDPTGAPIVALGQPGQPSLTTAGAGLLADRVIVALRTFGFTIPPRPRG